MSNMRRIIAENRVAFLFILKFVVLYLVLNTLYGLYIEIYYPKADPITSIVTTHTKVFLQTMYDDLSVEEVSGKPFVTILSNGIPILDVFEGCNAVNVVIVFTVFVVAFGGRVKRMYLFLACGIILLYVVNVLRVSMLFWIALNRPESMYFFHKFLFTAVIYVFVVWLWFYWVKNGRDLHAGT